MGLSQVSHFLLLVVMRSAEGGLDALGSRWKHGSCGRGGFTPAHGTSLISR